jgi:hypothetical protein
MNPVLPSIVATARLSSTPPINWVDVILHILIVTLAVTVLTVSFLAYGRRRSRRYLLLSIGFLFLFLSQFATLIEAAFYSDALITIPILGLHLSHVFDFLMLIFFFLGMTSYGQGVRKSGAFSGTFPGKSPPIRGTTTSEFGND